MKALPTQYKAFTAVINQKEDDLTFTDFKILLRNYEDQEKIHSGSESTSPSVMSIMSTNPHQPKHSNWCSYCKMKSHNTNQCYKKPQAPNSNHKQYCPQNMHQQATPRYCNICKNHSHDTNSAENQKGPNINLLDHLPQPKRKIRSTTSCFMSPSRALAQNQATSTL